VILVLILEGVDVRDGFRPSFCFAADCTSRVSERFLLFRVFGVAAADR
jgi:hypothetical protein